MPLLRAGCREAQLPENEVHTNSHANCTRMVPGLLRGNATQRVALRCKASHINAGAAIWQRRQGAQDEHAYCRLGLNQGKAQSSLSSVPAPVCREAKLPNDEMRKANRGLGRRNLVRNGFRAGTVRRWACGDYLLN